MTIEAIDLQVERLERPVLRDVSVRIEEGACVSIVGPNGAGKSTLMAALLGLIPAREGEVRLDGAVLSSLSRRQIAHRIAYVPQLQEGYLGFRVRDVVASGRYAHLDPLESPGEEDRTAVERAIDACRIGDLLDRTVDTLSGGERQKVSIAAALAQQAPGLFLDEPTTALDPAHRVDLIRIMRDCVGSDRTLLVICHDLNLPLALGGRVVALCEGEIRFDGPVEVLLDTERLADLFGTPFVLHREIDGSATSVHPRP